MADQKRDAEFESARNILLNLDDVVSTEEWLKVRSTARFFWNSHSSASV